MRTPLVLRWRPRGEGDESETPHGAPSSESSAWAVGPPPIMESLSELSLADSLRLKIADTPLGPEPAYDDLETGAAASPPDPEYGECPRTPRTTAADASVPDPVGTHKTLRDPDASPSFAPLSVVRSKSPRLGSRTTGSPTSESDAVEHRELERLLSTYGVETIAASDLQKGEFVGAGSFGSVFRGYLSGHVVAIKFPRNRRLFDKYCEPSDASFAEDVSSSLTEAFFLGRLRHPNIVLSYGVVLPSASSPASSPLSRGGSRTISAATRGQLGVYTPRTRSPGPSTSPGPSSVVHGPALVSEFMDLGSLSDLLRSNAPLDNWTKVSKMFCLCCKRLQRTGCLPT